MKFALFGGALELSLDAADMMDCSSVRPVPDNQEVYISRQEAAPVKSFILEILEPEEGLEFHAKELELPDEKAVFKCNEYHLYKLESEYLYVGLLKIHNSDILLTITTTVEIDFMGVLSSMKVEKELFTSD